MIEGFRRGADISPVIGGIQRPYWSVMVPTYNCARFLELALTSVLNQAPSVEDMEIIVVDDVSQHDDPEELVRRVGCGRVRFHRNPANLGAAGNFNNCIKLSSGKFVHILHGDDIVDEGFYEEIGSLFAAHPECAFAATRTIAVDEYGKELWTSQRVKELETIGNDVRSCLQANMFQAPSVVISRDFYERYGGFDEALCHVADWEMWVRAICKGGGIVSPKALARYRIFSGNDTSTLIQSGANIRDELKLVDIFSHINGFNRKKFFRRRARTALMQARHLRALGNVVGYRKNMSIYREIRSRTGQIRDWVRGCLGLPMFHIFYKTKK